MDRLTKKDRYGHWYTNEDIHDRMLGGEPFPHAYDGKPIDKLADYEDKQEQGLLIEKAEFERYKLTLFGIIRNSKVMPAGLAQGRTMKEINVMSLKTMEEVLKMVDCNSMGKHYSEAEEALARMKGE